MYERMSSRAEGKKERRENKTACPLVWVRAHARASIHTIFVCTTRPRGRGLFTAWAGIPFIWERAGGWCLRFSRSIGPSFAVPSIALYLYLSLSRLSGSSARTATARAKRRINGGASKGQLHTYTYTRSYGGSRTRGCCGNPSNRLL